MSKRTLHRHWASQGIDYRSIVNNVRLEAAAKLLRERHKPIKAVAHEVGFANPSAFYRAFKGYTGYSPSQYMSGASADTPADLSRGADLPSADR